MLVEKVVSDDNREVGLQVGGEADSRDGRSVGKYLSRWIKSKN